MLHWPGRILLHCAVTPPLLTGDADGEDSEDEDVDELVELGFSKKLTARTEKYRAQITEKLREVRVTTAAVSHRLHC